MADTRARDEETRIFRRAKQRPCDDFWHTLAVGIPIALVLFMILPLLFWCAGIK